MIAKDRKGGTRTCLHTGKLNLHRPRLVRERNLSESSIRGKVSRTPLLPPQGARGAARGGKGNPSVRVRVRVRRGLDSEAAAPADEAWVRTE